MNDDINGDLGDFLENDLLLGIDMDSSFRAISDSDTGMRIGLDDGIEDLWDYQDPIITPNKDVDPPLRPQFLGAENRILKQNPDNLQITYKIGFVNFNPYINPYSPINVMSITFYNKVMSQELAYARNNLVGIAKNLHVFVGCHTLLIDFLIFENVSEFVEKGLTEVLFEKPFKDCMGLEEDVIEGIIWFKIGDDKTMFNMPHACTRFSKLTIAQQNMMGPILRVSNEDKSKRIYHPCQKIKEFYICCLRLGKEYKKDE
ncbi:hypothetical protein Tco_0676768 [Tanacetum coccineum]